MLWVNISNILKVDKFSGIARTEYELCSYAYQLYQQKYETRFCTFDDCLGFIEIESQQLSEVLHNLKHDCVMKKKKIKFLPKLKRSTAKRWNTFKVHLGMVCNEFCDGDIIISVGQNLTSSEMIAFEKIKRKVDIHLRLLCHDLIPINYPEFFFKSKYTTVLKIYTSNL